MASHGHHHRSAHQHMNPQAATRYASHAPSPPQQQQQHAVVAPSGAPAGTFAPGTKIQVGSHRVVIQKYLSEGGFAHVYVVKMPKPIDGTDLAVLKRVAVSDKDSLRGMRIEVETMKRLKGHRMIVTYIDSHASEMRGGGYEVFLLMEYCTGGGLIDFMNTRLQHRLTEPEILNIFCDIAEGLACMHYLKPPLLHRDLKIENVLITHKGSARRFKLCDFGSAASPKPAPTTVVECRLLDEDIQKHTTLQYRSPEMIDVYRKQPMNEKTDIWALGVFLYKLCYYTTPFEDQGQLAILNVSYRFPSSPPFSDRLKKLIASMLRENMESRPNVYQVLKEACTMLGREVPIQDIYSGQDARADSRVPSKSSREEPQSQPAVGAVYSPPVEEKKYIPEVTPMRRGRPTAPSQQAPAQQSKPQAQVTKGDPFAALDSKSPPPAAGAPAAGEVDEFASRFPPLDQFSLLHDHGSKFDFDSSEKPLPPSEGAGSKVTERLADEVFASSRQNTPPVSRPQSVTPAPRPKSVTPAPVTGSRSSQYGESIITKPAPSQQQAPSEVSRAQSIISSNPELQAMTSQITSRYVSTGTSTDDLPYEPSKNSRRIVQMPAPEIIRPASVPQSSNLTGDSSQVPEPRLSVSARINSLQSQPQARQTASASPLLEAVRSQPSDLIDVVPRTNISVNRSRPVSTNLDNSTIDYLREKEAQARPQGRPTPSPRPLSQVPSPNLIPLDDDNETKAETSDLEFLRSMEDPKSANKRSSLTSLSGSKNMLAGRFGDAFKRFEASNPSQQQQQQPVDLTGAVRSPSPIKDTGRRDLTPIAGSEATDGRSDDGRYDDDMDNMTPEQRRDAEQRKLQEEEQRVKAAQEEYRKRVTEGGSAGSAPLPRSIGGVPRASSIQNRVQSLLNEEQKPATVQRTAQGYGKYTDESPTERRPKPEIARKPIAGSKPQISGSYAVRGNSTGSSTPPALPPKPTGGKPVAPKKPGYLNSLPTGSSPTKTRQAEQLVATDLPGQPALDMSPEDRDNYIRDFTQRFPSLSAMDASERSGSRS